MENDTTSMNPQDKKLIKNIVKGVVALIAVIFVLRCFAIVPNGHVGVMTRFGAVQNYTLEPGMHLKAPIDSVKNVETRTHKLERKVEAASKDLQIVNSTIVLNYVINKDQVADLYRQLRNDYESRVIEPAIDESIKSATALFTAEELITKRSEVRDSAFTTVKERLKQYHIIPESLSITNFDFSASFNEAIEKKVTAEQDALASKNRLEQIKYEAQQTIEKAKAEAESLRIRGDALRATPEITQLNAIDKWDGRLPTTMVPNAALPFIGVTK